MNFFLFEDIYECLVIKLVSFFISKIYVCKIQDIFYLIKYINNVFMILFIIKNNVEVIELFFRIYLEEEEKKCKVKKWLLKLMILLELY